MTLLSFCIYLMMYKSSNNLKKLMLIGDNQTNLTTASNWHIQTEFCSMLRTIFLMALLVQIDVGLHVPYELMSEELGLLCSPQDVLTHVTHLSKMPAKTLIPTQGCVSQMKPLLC